MERRPCSEEIGRIETGLNDEIRAGRRRGGVVRAEEQSCVKGRNGGGNVEEWQTQA